MYRAIFAGLTRKWVKTQHHRLVSRPPLRLRRRRLGLFRATLAEWAIVAEAEIVFEE